MELDPRRLSDLRVFSRDELERIGSDAAAAIAEQLDLVDRTLSVGDLNAAAEAAHSGRNEALAIGAREIADAFGALEQAARGHRSREAREAAGLARSLWPATREALSALAGAGHDAVG